MKKIILILILFFVQKSFCQEFNFNLFLEYEEVTTKEIDFFLLNDKDSTLYFHRKQSKGVEYAFLKDNFKKKQYQFEYQNYLKFKFLNTTDYKESTIQYKNPFFYKKLVISTDSLKTEVKILVYRNLKKTKVVREIKIIYDNLVEISETDILNNFTHGTFLNSDFKSFNRLPLEIEVDYYNGNKFKYVLVHKKQIETHLIVPE